MKKIKLCVMTNNSQSSINIMKAINTHSSIKNVLQISYWLTYPIFVLVIITIKMLYIFSEKLSDAENIMILQKIMKIKFLPKFFLISYGRF